MSGRMTGDETPRFSSSPTVMIETGVTSEPVPAVVGTSTSGRRGPLRLADAPGLVEILARAEQQRGELGDVERRAAAEADDAGGARRPAGLDRPHQRRPRRIGLDPVEDRDGTALRLQRSDRRDRKGRAGAGRDR